VYDQRTMPSTAQPRVTSLGPLEAEVMRIVWREGLRTVGEVTSRVNERRQKPLDYRTILTVMSRLTKKKMLRHRRKGNTYHFSPTMTEEEFAAKQGAATVAELVERWGEPAIAGVLEQLATMPEAMTRLKAFAGDQAGA
jgi:BlaI family penicillinase repressor